MASTIRHDIHFQSFQHHISSSFTEKTPLSTQIKEHLLVAYMEIDNIDMSAHVTDFSRTIEKVNKFVTFSEEASDCILTRLNKHQEQLQSVASNSESKDDQQRLVDCIEEAEQLTQVMRAVMNFNKKIEKVGTWLAEQGQSANIRHPRENRSVLGALPYDFALKLRTHTILSLSQIAEAPSNTTQTTTTTPTVERPTETEMLPEEAAPVQASVTLEVECDVGFGNELFIRGEGGCLSWGEGIKMTRDGEKWYHLLQANDKASCTFKFLVNDKIWEVAEGNHEFEMGSDEVHSLTIKMPAQSQ